jgi:hypothetical protein
MGRSEGLARRGLVTATALTQSNPDDDKNEDGSQATATQFLCSVTGD